MRVLVSGADGFVGTHMVRGLRTAGHEVTAAVFGRTPETGEIRVDLTRAEELVRLPDDIDAVVHTAGVVEPSAGARTMFAVNLLGTRHLLRWARSHSVRHFVHVSSIAVYGPLLLGEDRTEDTPRLGLVAGLPYMISKAHAEREVERSGLPFTMLRPPAIVGSGDTIISPAFAEALAGPGLPLLPGAHLGRRVSLAFPEGITHLVAHCLERGPLFRAVHAVDAEPSLAELAQMYAAALGQVCTVAPVSWLDVARRSDAAGFQWLATSARFGQHYSRNRLLQDLGYASPLSLETAVAAGISGLQGG